MKNSIVLWVLLLLNLFLLVWGFRTRDQLNQILYVHDMMSPGLEFMIGNQTFPSDTVKSLVELKSKYLIRIDSCK
ncbi:hypothetical protein BGP76_18955 [Reichenbachiella sp. MSK19-1]|nr:hypothetical protein BGP76_18955 [Reichenbachiella sp. MSK19-1]